MCGLMKPPSSRTSGRFARPTPAKFAKGPRASKDLLADLIVMDRFRPVDPEGGEEQPGVVDSRFGLHRASGSKRG